ncbi:MAG: conserved hypothetical plastid protein [Bacteroidota bacterium]|jgi:hypothetical protein
MSLEYHYLLMSQQDLLQNEVIEEIMRERANSYLLQNKKNDFWIVLSPKFIKDNNFSSKIKQTNFYKQRILSKNSKEFYAAIVSLNKEFITWMNLRLGYFENIDTFTSNSQENKNYVSNGVTGKFIPKEIEPKTYSSPFISNSKLIHPSILTNKYQKLLDLFYTINS